MVDDPPSNVANAKTSDSVRADAESFANGVQNEVCRAVAAGELVEAQAWLLTRRHPVTKALYTEDRYGFVFYKPAAIDNAARLDEAFFRLRQFAEQSAAVGVALAVPVRYQEKPAAGAEASADARDAVYLVVEHRALPHPRRRIVFFPAAGAERDAVHWIDLDNSLPPVFADNCKSVHTLLPALD